MAIRNLVLGLTIVATCPAWTHAAEPAIDLRLGGIGGLYLLAEPGELTIDIEKRDRNRRGARTELRAVLAGPDRKTLQEAVIPDDGLPADGKLGPARRIHLSTRVPRKGVYAVCITVSGDRYGDQILWGFHTNCPRYLIETSRGHRDARHEEPLVLGNADQPADVCFLRRSKPFGVELSGLPKGAAQPTLYDAQGKLQATLNVDPQGQATHQFAAQTPSDSQPWRLHLPLGRAKVEIDGLTRWDAGDRFTNLSLWTPDARSFFPLPCYRWILAPYHRTLYGRSGERGQYAFTVHNNADRPRTIRLELEMPGQAWPVELSTAQLALAPNQSREVVVRYTVPAEGQTRECHLRATPAEDPDFSTYSTLTVTGGAAPASRPLAMPLVLRPYEHENEQFGYAPDYPVENQPYFDLDNRAFLRADSGVAAWRDGKWITFDVRSAGRNAAPVGSKLAFDRRGHLYLPGVLAGKAALLDSANGGPTFTAWPLPGPRRGYLEIEEFTGHNPADGPPALLRYIHTQSDPKLKWREVHDLELLIPRVVDGRIAFAEPVLVSRQCIGLASHSGMPSSVVSRDGRIHVVWGEATDPAQKVPGVPTYVATYDRQGRRLGQPALVGYGPPANDVHNSPSITIDGRGYLHVLVGTHGQPFPYARSLQPNTAHEGWTAPVPVGEGLRLTYVGMVCSPDNALHLVCRYWRTGEQPFPASHYATLAHLTKPADGPWQAPQLLVVPPLSEYSVFYHRLAIDRTGRLFLSYDYWSTHWFYRTDNHLSRRALLCSPDAGRTWKLVETSDLVGR
jgi:hypothetical protein